MPFLVFPAGNAVEKPHFRNPGDNFHHIHAASGIGTRPRTSKGAAGRPHFGTTPARPRIGKEPNANELGSLSRSSRRLLQIWDQLTVRNGVLCRRFETSEGTSAVTQTIIPEALREEVLTDLHEGILGGHLGIDKTLARLKNRFYWPGHYNDVCDWCQKCGICAARKSPSPKAHAPLTSIKVGYPMQLVAMDIVAPFPESPAGNTHILVVADYFTRWTEAYPIPNQKATTVASKLTDEVFFRFPPQNSCTRTRVATSSQMSSPKSADFWE